MHFKSFVLHAVPGRPNLVKDSPFTTYDNSRHPRSPRPPNRRQPHLHCAHHRKGPQCIRRPSQGSSTRNPLDRVRRLSRPRDNCMPLQTRRYFRTSKHRQHGTRQRPQLRECSRICRCAFESEEGGCVWTHEMWRRCCCAWRRGSGRNAQHMATPCARVSFVLMGPHLFKLELSITPKQIAEKT